MLFPVSQSTSGRAQTLISYPLTDCKDAVSILKVHSGLEYHLTSQAKMDTFCCTMSHPGQRLDTMMSVASQERVAKNRAILTSIIKCVKFCGRHRIAPRGHRDDSTSDDLSLGKFKALVNFRMESGDELLQSHVASCSSPETYISKTSQNELLECMGDYIREHIVTEVKESKYFSISADEVTDVSNWGKLGIVFRYVRDGQAVEKLAGFLACDKVRGADIFKAIKQFVGDISLDITLCRGQGYDGAGGYGGCTEWMPSSLQC